MITEPFEFTPEQLVLEVAEVLTTITTTQDTEVLKSATEELKTKYYKSPNCIPVLICVLQQHPEAAVRQLAGVEAKKLISAKTWKNKPFASEIRETILRSTLAEQSSKVRNASVQVIVAIASIDVRLGLWPELATLCESGAFSEVTEMRAFALNLIYSLLEKDPSLLREVSYQDLMELFQTTLQDPESREVRQLTLRCMGEFSQQIFRKDKEVIEWFREMLPTMIHVLNEAFDGDDETDARNGFEVFETLLIVEASLISKGLSNLVEHMLGHCADKEMNPTYREMALVWCATAVRFKRQRIQSLELGPLILNVMLAIASEPDDREIYEDEDSPVRLALVLIEALAEYLPEEHVLGPFIALWPELIISSDKFHRRAALAALTGIMRASPESMHRFADPLLRDILATLKDSEGTVVRVALMALEQYTQELPDNISKNHATVVPLVFELLASKDLETMKVACNALDTILEWIPQDALGPYLPTLMSRLIDILTTPVDPEVKDIVVLAIGTAAQSSKIEFGPFVEHTMEILFAMPELEDPARFELRASVTDTFAFIASAAGTDSFQDHFERTFKFAFEGLKIGAPRLREAAFCFFSIMAEVLKDKMAFTLPDIMPHLIKTLAQDELGVDTEIVKENGDYNAAGLIEKLGNIDYHANFIEHSKLLDVSSDSEDDESIDINVNSALLLEKVVAAEAVGELCKHIGEAFFPYLAETTSILVEMADSYFQGGQKAALGALWKFVMTLGKIQVTEDWQPGLPVKIPLPEDVVKLTEVVRKKSIECLKSEDDSDTVAEVFRSMGEAMTLLGPGILGEFGVVPREAEGAMETDGIGGSSNDEGALGIELPIEVQEMILAAEKSGDELPVEIQEMIRAAELKATEEPMETEPSPNDLDANVFSALVLLVLQREHPCQEEDRLDTNEPDEEEEEKSPPNGEIDSVLFDSAVDALIALARVLKEQFVPELNPFYIELEKFTKSKSSEVRAIAIGGLAEIAGIMGSIMEQNTMELLRIFVTTMGEDSSMEVKSNAAYGTGRIIEESSKSLSDYYDLCFSGLRWAFQPDVPQAARDNAVGCISRMIRRQPGMVLLRVVLPMVFRYLPLKDNAESETTWLMIHELYVAHNPMLHFYIDQILPPLAKVLAWSQEPQVSNPTKQLLWEMFKDMWMRYPLEMEGHPEYTALMQY